MSGIRVTYSGLISLVVGLISVITGMVFTLIVTRQLSVNEFGIWTLIGGLLTYVVITEPIISYWLTREIARGLVRGKTAIFSSGIFSSGGIAIYLIIAYFITIQSKIDFNIFIISSVLIPVIFFDRTLSAINFAWKPHVVSYGLLSVEVSKIPAGLILVYMFDLGLSGAIYTTIIAYLISISVNLFYARKKMYDKIKFTVIKKWLKLSWLSLYPGIANFIYRSDVVIFSIITGSVTGLAFFGVANTIASLVMQSGGISRAIYPKLLEVDNRAYLKESLTKMFYFAIPFCAISITFMKPALFALNPAYVEATLIVIFLTFRMFLANLIGVFQLALSGIEKVDLKESANFKDYLKSKLFFVPSLSNIQAVTYLSILIVILLILREYSFSQIELVQYWSFIIFITEIPLVIYLYFLVKKHFQEILEQKIVLKYIIVSVGIFLPMYFITNEFLIYEPSIFDFLPNLMMYVLISIGLYLLTTYFTDSKTKNLFKAIITEIRQKK